MEGRKTGHWRPDSGAALPYRTLDEIRPAGYIDYVVASLLYSDGTANALSRATGADGGFGDDDLQLVHDRMPDYAPIAEIKSVRRFAATMLQTCAGREPGELILEGQPGGHSRAAATPHSMRSISTPRQSISNSRPMIGGRQ